MVISFNGTKAPNIFAAPTAPEETSSESTGSFTDQLSSALGNQPGNGSDVKTPQSQDSGARQVLGAAADSGSPAPVAPAASAPAAAAASNGTVSSRSTMRPVKRSGRDRRLLGRQPQRSTTTECWGLVQRMSLANQLASRVFHRQKHHGVGIRSLDHGYVKSTVIAGIHPNQSVDATLPWLLPGQTPGDPASGPGSIQVSCC
jgi:hypothetical protein